MRRLRYNLIPGLCMVLAVWCAGCGDDDDYVYPSVLTELVDGYVNPSGVVESVRTDRGETFFLTNRMAAAKDMETDKTYRFLCVYEPSEETAGEALVYSLKQVYASAPIPVEEFAEGIKSDPLSMQSFWRGGDYLNMVALPKAQSIAHRFRFVQDSIVTREGITRLYLRLYHDQNNDVEAYEQKVYLSVSLKESLLQQGDSVCFRVNTYDKGWETWRFAY